MRFLVTGSAGLVGSQVVNDLTEQNHQVYSCYHNETPTHGIPIQLDLTDQEKIKQTLQEIKPDRVIHLAAMTNVDLCESKKELSFLLNVKATEIIAKQAAKQRTFFVYVSTDYVFDGIQGMKKEHDTTNPLGFYGRSKLEGEIALNKIASSWCIARTSTPFGIHHKKKSFPLWIKENLESNKEVPVLVDQFTSPTYTPNLSKMLIEITTRQITGRIHVAGATRISRYDLAKLVSDRLYLNKNLLKLTKIDEMNWKAQRPKDSSLDVSLATEILNEKPQTIQQSIELFLSEL
ncbi:dTDP-4-dehydrorhamnose reductase [Nitrosopumilus sp.]|uniref:dTDP-4-dehydrorhamnose reductase n=1 Tax=Nitrosopumilus sp. TaxID=2024843 RepID=UPI00293011CF|nr:dTDP-4-dehydrorhamnose reductase [Nitrosopumilus sp.]